LQQLQKKVRHQSHYSTEFLARRQAGACAERNITLLMPAGECPARPCTI
jgi:hypothetical protein